MFVTLLCSCSKHNNVTNEESLKGNIVTPNSKNEGKWPLYLFGDVLYAVDKDNVVAGELNKNAWQRADPIFLIGHGHNEFGRVVLSQDNDGTLYVLNRPFEGNQLLGLTKIPHAENLDIVKDETKWEKYDLGQMPALMFDGRNFVVLSDSSILVTGAPAEDMCHVFSIIDFKNQTVTPLDYWPDDGSPSEHISQKLMRYTYECGLLGNGKGKFLYWNGWGMLAFIFTIDGTKTNILNYMYSDPFPFKEKPTTERIACCADNNRIYLLLRDSDGRGKKLDKYEYPFIFGNTIEVYDWDGVKQQVINLDYYGQSIMISKDGNTLYLLTEYSEEIEEPHIYSYDLSAIK